MLPTGSFMLMSSSFIIITLSSFILRPCWLTDYYQSVFLENVANKSWVYLPRPLLSTLFSRTNWKSKQVPLAPFNEVNAIFSFWSQAAIIYHKIVKSAPNISNWLVPHIKKKIITIFLKTIFMFWISPCPVNNLMLFQFSKTIQITLSHFATSLHYFFIHPLNYHC